MIGCAEMQGAFVTTAGITPLLLLLSVVIIFAVDCTSDVVLEGQVVGFPDGPINGELLLERTLSAELEVLLRIDSSLDDFRSSFSRSSSLNKRYKYFYKMKLRKEIGKQSCMTSIPGSIKKLFESGRIIQWIIIHFNVGLTKPKSYNKNVRKIPLQYVYCCRGDYQQLNVIKMMLIIKCIIEHLNNIICFVKHML